MTERAASGDASGPRGPRVLACVLAAVLASVSCAGAPAPAPPAPSGPPAALEDTSAAADDVVVATVSLTGGAARPVWGSCVRAQAERGISKEQALDECIAFELMAQEAERRDLATDPETVRATRTALVNQLVAKDYEAKFTRPSDFGSMWNQLAERNRLKFDHDEVRASAYVRVPLAKTATPAEEAAARSLAVEIAAGLDAERGLLPPHLVTLAEQLAAGRAKLATEVVGPYLRIGALDRPYAEALFAIPEVGRTSPAVRTAYGWDVILWSAVIPAAHPSPDELAAALLPEVKRTYFSTWVNQVVLRLGVKVQIEAKNLPLLEAL